MSAIYRDILGIVCKHQPITTAGITDKLLDSGLGYGGGKAWDEFRDQVSKCCSYMKKQGQIYGKETEVEKGRPIMSWTATSEESSLKDSKPTINRTIVESTPVASITQSVAGQNRKMPIEIHAALFGAIWDGCSPCEAFMRGIAYAEKHHGITKEQQ